MTTSIPASASSAAIVAPPAPDPTITTPHSTCRSPVTSLCRVSPAGMLAPALMSLRPGTGWLARVRAGREHRRLTGTYLRPVGRQTATRDRRDVRARPVAQLLLHLGQLVIAQHDQALEPLDHCGKPAGPPGQHSSQISIGRLVPEPGEPPPPRP